MLYAAKRLLDSENGTGQKVAQLRERYVMMMMMIIKTQSVPRSKHITSGL